MREEWPLASLGEREEAVGPCTNNCIAPCLSFSIYKGGRTLTVVLEGRIS